MACSNCNGTGQTWDPNFPKVLGRCGCSDVGPAYTSPSRNRTASASSDDMPAWFAWAFYLVVGFLLFTGCRAIFNDDSPRQTPDNDTGGDSASSADWSGTWTGVLTNSRTAGLATDDVTLTLVRMDAGPDVGTVEYVGLGCVFHATKSRLPDGRQVTLDLETVTDERQNCGTGNTAELVLWADGSHLEYTTTAGFKATLAK